MCYLYRRRRQLWTTSISWAGPDGLQAPTWHVLLPGTVQILYRSCTDPVQRVITARGVREEEKTAHHNPRRVGIGKP